MVRIVDMNIQRDPMNGMIQGYVSYGRRGAHALVLMVAVKGAILGYADHLMTRRNAESSTAIKYIQEYQKEEGVRLKVVTLKTLDITMMDIGQLTTDIEEHKENIFYIIREHDPTRGNPPCIARRRVPIWKTGHA